MNSYGLKILNDLYVEQERLTLPEHMSSSLILMGFVLLDL
jgi:hypothetical protein